MYRYRNIEIRSQLDDARRCLNQSYELVILLRKKSYYMERHLQKQADYLSEAQKHLERCRSLRPYGTRVNN